MASLSLKLLMFGDTLLILPYHAYAALLGQIAWLLIFTLLSGEIDGFICLDECLRFVGSDQDFSDFFWLKPASFNLHLKIHHLFICHNRNLEAQDICLAICFSQLLSGHMFRNELGPHTFRSPAFLLKSCGWSKERKILSKTNGLYIYIYIYKNASFGKLTEKAMQVWTSWMHVCSDIRVALFAVDFRVTFTTTGSVSSRTLTQNLVSAPDSRTAGTATRYCLQTQRYTHTAVTSMDVKKKKSQIRIHVHQLQISQDIKKESIIEANLRSRSCLAHMHPADKGAQRPCPTQNPRLTHNWLWCSSESASVK